MTATARYSESVLAGGFFWLLHLAILAWRYPAPLSVNMAPVVERIDAFPSALLPSLNALAAASAVLLAFVTGMVLHLSGSMFFVSELRVFHVQVVSHGRSLRDSIAPISPRVARDVEFVAEYFPYTSFFISPAKLMENQWKYYRAAARASGHTTNGLLEGLRIGFLRPLVVRSDRVLSLLRAYLAEASPENQRYLAGEARTWRLARAFSAGITVAYLLNITLPISPDLSAALARLAALIGLFLLGSFLTSRSYGRMLDAYFSVAIVLARRRQEEDSASSRGEEGGGADLRAEDATTSRAREAPRGDLPIDPGAR